jgi:3-oxoacyl-[acyl-carrier-protein] synthase II
MTRRVVITGVGVISPLGNTAEKLWAGLSGGASGVRKLAAIPAEAYPSHAGAEARDFTGSIEDFGPLDKAMSRNIKKNLKVMCREMQTGIAAAQLALTDCGLSLATANLDRIGCVYGSDYMLTLPQDFVSGIRGCLDEQGRFDFSNWAEKGLPTVEPLWLLKYLPNLPASHIAIFNDLRGPNNSLTMREASSNLAVAEAYCTIVRGHADAMLAGATGSKIHPLRTVHAITQEEIAARDGDPAKLSRPFDKHRCGSVIGEGAACVMLEELEHANARGAKILGEVIGYGASAVADNRGVGHYKIAFGNVFRQGLKSAGMTPDQIGHVNAHGLSNRRCDAEEAQAIGEIFASRKSPVPVVAPKGNFGNLGAASGLVELIGSLLAFKHGHLFPAINYETPDLECPVNIVKDGSVASGDVFINCNVSPQGQASAVVVRRF